MAIQDPYPEALDDMPFNPPATNLNVAASALPSDPLVAAVNRLAQAVEQNTLALLHPVGTPRPPQPVQNAPQGLAPLPPVTVVANKPPCTWHGVDKVRPSSKGGFYCTAQPGIGQPNTNPKGYCTWHT